MQEVRRNLMNIGDFYRPQPALEKLKKAQAFSMPVYIYGATGCGKTLLVERFLARVPYTYVSMGETVKEPSTRERANRSEPEPVQDEKTGFLVHHRNTEYASKDKEHTIVVLDDVHEVTNEGTRAMLTGQIKNLLEDKSIWLIMISRSRIPKWLSFLRMRYMFTVIGEEELLLSKEAQDAFLAWCGMRFDEEQLQQMWGFTHGIPLALAFLASEGGNVREAFARGFDYLDTHVYDQWPREMHDFLIELSVVDSFDRELASMITGSGEVARLLDCAEEMDSFFVQRGDIDVWEYRPNIRMSLRRRLERLYSKSQVNRLCGNAALYYEIRGRIPEALTMYERMGDMHSISRLLVANARKNPADGFYFELRRYYLQLPTEMVLDSPELMSAMSMLQSILMNNEESERWYRLLEEYSHTASGSDRREAKARLLYLDFALPHRGSSQMLTLIKKAGPLMLTRQVSLGEFSATSNLPSILNGGKDFCEWTKRDKELAATMGPLLELVVGRYGNGLVSLGMAESSLEKGVDLYDVMALAAKGRMQADGGGKPEMSFVAVGVKVWCAILEGSSSDAKELLESFRQRSKEEAPKLLSNLDAFLARCALYEDNRSAIAEWMEKAPDEKEDFCTTERFRYLTKVRGYLAEGKERAAGDLLQQLLYYAQQQKRTYIGMEAKLLLAITLKRMGDDSWKSQLQACISEAEEYHFVRLFSREGGAVYPLLTSADLTWKDEAFRRQVLKECRKVTACYPDYLKAAKEDQPVFSERALEILRLQAQGVSAAQIAKLLHISEPTVKYHNRETYRKLGVGNKSAAITEARKRKLI